MACGVRPIIFRASKVRSTCFWYSLKSSPSSLSSFSSNSLGSFALPILHNNRAMERLFIFSFSRPRWRAKAMTQMEVRSERLWEWVSFSCKRVNQSKASGFRTTLSTTAVAVRFTVGISITRPVWALANRSLAVTVISLYNWLAVRNSVVNVVLFRYSLSFLIFCRLDLRLNVRSLISVLAMFLMVEKVISVFAMVLIFESSDGLAWPLYLIFSLVSSTSI